MPPLTHFFATDEEIIDYLSGKIYRRRADWEKLEDNNVRIEDAGDITEYIECVMVYSLPPMVCICL